MGVLKTADMGYTIFKTVLKLVKSQHLVCHDIGILWTSDQIRCKMLWGEQTELLFTFIRNKHLKQHLVHQLVIACPHTLHRRLKQSIESGLAAFEQELSEFPDAFELGVRLSLHLFLNENYLFNYLHQASAAVELVPLDLWLVVERGLLNVLGPFKLEV